jgi:2-polyprenyl-6-methoxyphenol hydroxylase-like FAD-dependent oxidoreductase
VIGLSMAMMLARQGHSVTILEQDSAPLPVSPEAAWCTWGRQGVAQFRMPHYLHPPVRQLLESYLPDVKEALLRADCVTFDVLATMPPSVTDRTPREGDERFITITGRRPTIEYAFASIAERLFPVRHGVAVVGLLTGPSDAKGIPHVTGVRTVDGEEVSADLIIDAMGRGSKLPSWLEAVGARRPIEEVEAYGFVYYTRYFRSTTAMLPLCRAALHTYFQSFSLLTLPDDAGTWSVTVVITSNDQPLKKLRDPKHWTALVAACPLHAHWLTMEVIAQHLDNPLALALAQDSLTETRVTPWYRNTIEIDRAWIARFSALIEGRPEPQSTDPRTRVAKALSVAMMYDADLFRAANEIRSLLALPQEVIGRPGLVDRMMDIASTHQAVTPPGPSRKELLEMLA